MSADERPCRAALVLRLRLRAWSHAEHIDRRAAQGAALCVGKLERSERFPATPAAHSLLAIVLDGFGQAGDSADEYGEEKGGDRAA
jgi:hypothetical protein